MAGVICLESEFLLVDVLPDNGGRIASIRCRRTGAEFLLSGSDYRGVARFAADAPFHASDCAGMDECLPGISGSGPETPGGSVPDHGDLWRHPWSIVTTNARELQLSTKCFSRPLSFTRTLRVDRHVLHFDYRIQNLSEAPVAFLYAPHPLFAVDEGDRLFLPREVERVLLHSSRGDRAGHSGEWIDWPGGLNGTVALDRVGKASDDTAEMLYTGKLGRGICALYRTQLQQAVVLHFDTNALPYLGLWICNGGWPDGPALRKQYAVAMEPTVAPFGSLSAASFANAAPVVYPGDGFSFSLRMEFPGSVAPCLEHEVRHYVDTYSGC